MSDHPREAERNLKRIYICDDVWYNVFDWTSRADLGLKIAPISARFDGLVDRHLRTVRWTIGHIGFGQFIIDHPLTLWHIVFRRSMAVVWKDGNVNSSGVLLEESALLDVPPPSNLIGFRKIEISYVDQDVVAFLRGICHLFNTVDITFTLPTHLNIDECPAFITFIWPLIARRLYQLDHDRYNFLQLRELISLTVLRDSANLRVIHASVVFPEMPADDGTDASEGQAIAKWLHTPRSDGRPKVLKCWQSSKHIATKLEALKMEFVNAADSPVSYIIWLGLFKPNVGIEPFEFVNERTRERMTFEKDADQDEDDDYDYWLLKRGPIWWGKSEWADSESRAKASAGDFSEEMNVICCYENIEFDENITFDDDFIA